MEVIDYVEVPRNIVQGVGDGRLWGSRESKNNLVLTEQHLSVKYGRILIVWGEWTKVALNNRKLLENSDCSENDNVEHMIMYIVWYKHALCINTYCVYNIVLKYQCIVVQW